MEKIADYRDQIKKIDIEISSFKNTKKSGFFNLENKKTIASKYKCY